MAWNDSTETVVGGTGEVYAAPVGTPLPTSPDAALNGAFVGLGFHTEDGVSVNKTLEVTEHGAWQTKHPIRRDRESEDFQINFSLLQWNENNVPLAFGGGEIVDLGGGGYRYNPPAEGDALDERALVADVIDGDNILRFVVPRGTITEGIESTFRSSEMSALAVAFKSLQPDDNSEAWYYMTNLAGHAVGS